MYRSYSRRKVRIEPESVLVSPGWFIAKGKAWEPRLDVAKYMVENGQ